MSELSKSVFQFQYYHRETAWDVVDSYILKDKDNTNITEDNIDAIIDEIAFLTWVIREFICQSQFFILITISPSWFYPQLRQQLEHF